MELESTSSNSNISSDSSDSDEYEEDVSYIIIDLGTEVTLDMITNNFEILNNINPSSFNFNQNRNHQNQDHLPSSNPDLDNNINNETNDDTASTSATGTANYSQKPFHYYIRPSANHDKESVESGDLSNLINKKESNDIDYSLIGLDTDTPYLRIGNIHFRGEYDETIGTDLIFFPEPDPMNPRQQKLTYQCQTTKKIKFSQVNLQEINLDTTNELDQFNIDDDNEWEDKYSINNKNYSLNDQELFNIESNLHDNSDDEDDGNSQNDTVVVDKGKRREIIDQEKVIDNSNVEKSRERDKMELD